jgi:methyl-accepting chemotaxis protein
MSYLFGMRLGTRLVLLFLVGVIVSIAIVGFLSFIRARYALQTARITALESIADVKVDKIETFFSERRGDIRVAQDFFIIKQNLPILNQHANNRTTPEYTAAKKELDDQLKIFQKTYKYDNVMLVSPDGKVVYVTNEEYSKQYIDNPLPDPEGKAFDKGKNGVYVTDIFNLGDVSDSKLTMFITAPAFDLEQTLVGVIAFKINMDHIFGFIQDTTGLGETGETLIGKKEGNKAIFLNPLRHDRDAALKRKVLIGSESAIPVQEAVQDIEGSGLSIDYRAKEIIAVWRHVPSLQWGLVAKIDTSEAFASVNALGTFIIIIGLILSGIVAGVGWLFGRTISNPISLASQEISSTVSQIATTSAQHESTAVQQSTSVNETTTTITELDASARKTSEQAESAMNQSQEALTTSEEGFHTVEKTLEGMDNLKDKVSAIAEEILKLSEQIGQIGNITALVSDLANQTNLLALNAAVEAVRAGEHGKGFSVVAVEIRKLADESKKSAGKIKEIVSEIEKSTDSTVMVTEEGTKTVEESIKLANITGESFKALVNANNNVAENVQQIMLNAKQQASATQQIVESMNSITTGAKETASGLGQTKEGIEKLNKTVDRLKEMV